MTENDKIYGTTETSTQSINKYRPYLANLTLFRNLPAIQIQLATKTIAMDLRKESTNSQGSKPTLFFRKSAKKDKPSKITANIIEAITPDPKIKPNFFSFSIVIFP